MEWASASCPHSSVSVPFLSQFTEESGNWIRKKRKREERSGAHNQSPEPVSKCVSVC